MDDLDYEIPADRLPPGFVESIGSPPPSPAVPRPAATVVLLRDGDDGPQVLLLRRNRATGFVPGAYVFPGGRVDLADAAPSLIERWDGLTLEAAEGRLGLPSDATPPAIAYFTAAIREAFEETGLLVGPQAPLPSPTEPRIAEARNALLEATRPFDHILDELQVRLEGSLVEYIAHWVTPSVEPRRYDTRFFAARVPSDAEAAYDRREMTDAVWLTAGQALDRHRAGTLPMIFPTIRTLEDLLDFTSVEQLISHYRSRPIPLIMPEIVRTPRGVGLRIP